MGPDAERLVGRQRLRQVSHVLGRDPAGRVRREADRVEEVHGANDLRRQRGARHAERSEAQQQRAAGQAPNPPDGVERVRRAHPSPAEEELQHQPDPQGGGEPAQPQVAVVVERPGSDRRHQPDGAPVEPAVARDLPEHGEERQQQRRLHGLLERPLAVIRRDQVGQRRERGGQRPARRCEVVQKRQSGQERDRRHRQREPAEGIGGGHSQRRPEGGDQSRAGPAGSRSPGAAAARPARRRASSPPTRDGRTCRS